jgi:hypothetical protein
LNVFPKFTTFPFKGGLQVVESKHKHYQSETKQNIVETSENRLVVSSDCSKVDETGNFQFDGTLSTHLRVSTFISGRFEVKKSHSVSVSVSSASIQQINSKKQKCFSKSSSSLLSPSSQLLMLKVSFPISTIYLRLFFSI